MIHQDPMRRNKLFTRLAVVGLILITLSIYFPPFDWAFVGDDYVQFDYIKEIIGNPWAIFSLFNPYYLAWYYRPLQLVWFALLEGIFHFVPNGFYWIELLFHALAIALVYRVARQFRLGVATAVFTAALFAIHSHWVDVITWLSSIAIVLAAVFSLLALSAWLDYLKRPSTCHLLLTLFFCLLTFLSHEEAVLLPPFLLLMLLAERVEIRNWRLKVRRTIANHQSPLSKKELFLFATLGLLTAAYLYFQFTRPNLTIDIASRSTTEWLAYFTWPKLVEFILVTIFRFSFVRPVLELSGWAASLLAAGVLLLLGLWFYWGSRTVRLGLVWLALHLAFIYWALWSQLPNLYAGRHIYQGMIGLVLAIGASLAPLLHTNISPQSAQKNNKKTLRSLRPLRFKEIVVLVVITAVLLHHINNAQDNQRAWLNNVTEEANARQQLAELFPSITPENHFFSVRFPIAPQFTRSVAQLWYDTPLERPGGSLDHLRTFGQADRSFVVLDYVDGQLYDLMPELRQHDKTIFLWAKSAELAWIGQDGGETAVPNPEQSLPVVTAQNGSQLALKMTPENGRWLSYSTQIFLPANSALQTAVLPQPGLRYRIRLQTRGGEEHILLDVADGQAQTWQMVNIPLDLFADSTVMLRLEVFGENLGENSSGYWANPRVVVN